MDSAGDMGGYASISLDSSDRAHICYCKFDGAASLDLRHATNASGLWVAATVDASGDIQGYSTATVLDSSDRVHVTYFDLMNYYLRYANSESVPEDCHNEIDDDSDGKVDGADPDCAYPGTANAEAAVYGGNSLSASGSFNALTLLLVPAGAVILLRILRRKR